MKFGGSSLANGDRIDHVAHLIKGQIETAGYRPRAVVCSAMGKTTNNLLSAGEFALGTSLLKKHTTAQAFVVCDKHTRLPPPSSLLLVHSCQSLLKYRFFAPSLCHCSLCLFLAFYR